MALQLLKETARDLRLKGKSITEISQSLDANKSTVSYWCRDISLSKAQQQVLVMRQQTGGAKGRLKAAEQKRSLRIENVRICMDQGARDVGTLNRRDFFILGMALYWGEGYKSGNEECGLTNSDPFAILAFIEWLRRTYDVQNADLILRVSLNESHSYRASTVEKYWSNVTHVPRSQFTKTSLIKAKTKKLYRNPEKHFGTLRVKVRKATSLRRRIIGSINALKKQVTK